MCIWFINSYSEFPRWCWLYLSSLCKSALNSLDCLMQPLCPCTHPYSIIFVWPSKKSSNLTSTCLLCLPKLVCLTMDRLLPSLEREMSLFQSQPLPSVHAILLLSTVVHSLQEFSFPPSFLHLSLNFSLVPYNTYHLALLNILSTELFPSC